MNEWPLMWRQEKTTFVTKSNCQDNFLPNWMKTIFDISLTYVNSWIDPGAHTFIQRASRWDLRNVPVNRSVQKKKLCRMHSYSNKSVWALVSWIRVWGNYIRWQNVCSGHPVWCQTIKSVSKTYDATRQFKNSLKWQNHTICIEMHIFHFFQVL